MDILLALLYTHTHTSKHTHAHTQTHTNTKPRYHSSLPKERNKATKYKKNASSLSDEARGLLDKMLSGQSLGLFEPCLHTHTVRFKLKRVEAQAHMPIKILRYVDTLLSHACWYVYLHVRHTYRHTFIHVCI